MTAQTHRQVEGGRMAIGTSPTPDQIKKRLLQDEAVIWLGYPARGIRLSALDIFLVPFSLLWTGFALFWVMMAVHGGAPFPFVLFGSAFVFVGLFAVFGRFLLDSWLRGHMVYALTERRVLIARSGPWPSFKAVNLDRLSEINLNEKSNGKGTIRFGPTSIFAGFNRSASFTSWVPALDPISQFIAIDDVQRVFAMIQEQSRAHDDAHKRQV